MTATATAAPLPRRRFDIGPATRTIMTIGALAVGGASVAAVTRALLGFAPGVEHAKTIAIVVHVAAVLPAVPLGLYVLLTRKGDARHKLLGRIWMLLMLVTAVSAIFIRQINQGSFSWIHLFVPLAIVTMVRAIAAARAGRIADHKRHLVGMFLGALLIPGLFTFLPGRLMYVWLFG